MVPIRRLVPVAILFAGVAFAAAQELGGGFGAALNIGTLGVTVAQGEATRQMFGRYARPGSSSSSARRVRTRKASAASLSYRRSAAVSKRVLEAFVTVITRNDPKTEATVRGEIARADPMAKLAVEMRKHGLRENNLAAGMAVYLVQAWYGAHGRTASGDAVYRAVSRQAARVFGAMPTLARASDTTKQETSESMVLYGSLYEDAIVAAKKDPATLAKVKANIATHARNTLGFDLAALRLGPNGLY